MKLMERIAVAPLALAEPIELWYTGTIPKPIRFVLAPVRWVVCVAAASAVIVWVLPFIGIEYLHKTWKEFK